MLPRLASPTSSLTETTHWASLPVPSHQEPEGQDGRWRRAMATWCQRPVTSPRSIPILGHSSQGWGWPENCFPKNPSASMAKMTLLGSFHSLRNLLAPPKWCLDLLPFLRLLPPCSQSLVAPGATAPKGMSSSRALSLVTQMMLRPICNLEQITPPFWASIFPTVKQQ